MPVRNVEIAPMQDQNNFAVELELELDGETDVSQVNKDIGAASRGVGFDEDDAGDEYGATLVGPGAKPQISPRADKRIKKLTREKNYVLSELEKERAERQRLAEALLKTQSDAAAAVEFALGDRKKSLESQFAMAKATLVNAETTGDSNAKVEASLALNQITSQMAEIDKVMSSRTPNQNQNQNSNQERAHPQQQQQVQPKLTAPVQKWLRNNDEWFQKDSFLTNAAVGLTNELLSEGYDPNSEDDAEEFVKELEKRLSTEAGGRLKKYRDDPPKSPVQGGRPSIGQPTSGVAKKKISLTARDYDVMQKFGIPKPTSADPKTWDPKFRQYWDGKVLQMKQSGTN